MRLIGRNKLDVLNCVDAELERWVSAWTAEVSNAHWVSQSDLFGQYPRVVDMGNDVFRFKVGSTDMVLDVLISFVHKIAVVIKLTRAVS